MTMTNKKPVSGQLTNNKKLVLNDITSLPLVIISSDLNNLNKLPEVKFARKSGREKFEHIFVLAPQLLRGVWSRYPMLGSREARGIIITAPGLFALLPCPY